MNKNKGDTIMKKVLAVLAAMGMAVSMLPAAAMAEEASYTASVTGRGYPGF